MILTLLSQTLRFAVVGEIQVFHFHFQDTFYPFRGHHYEFLDVRILPEVYLQPPLQVQQFSSDCLQ